MQTITTKINTQKIKWNATIMGHSNSHAQTQMLSQRVTPRLAENRVGSPNHRPNRYPITRYPTILNIDFIVFP